VSPQLKEGQLWQKRPWRMRRPRRQVVEIVALTPETVAWLAREDEMAGRPIVRRGSVVSRAYFTKDHVLIKDVKDAL
jgi:hypothetical protein